MKMNINLSTVLTYPIIIGLSLTYHPNISLYLNILLWG
nr:MAG TPA: hypothetical protein [Caudoviricetes sp.]